jgi:hypothetical protein
MTGLRAGRGTETPRPTLTDLGQGTRGQENGSGEWLVARGEELKIPHAKPFGAQGKPACGTPGGFNFLVVARLNESVPIFCPALSGARPLTYGCLVGSRGDWIGCAL